MMDYKTKLWWVLHNGSLPSLWFCCDYKTKLWWVLHNIYPVLDTMLWDYKTKLWWVLHNPKFLLIRVRQIIKQSCGGYYTTVAAGVQVRG